MKILMVHNDYGRYSGEEFVVDRFIADGRKSGITIETLRRTSKFSRDNLFGKVRGFFAGIYCVEGVSMMKEALRTFKPDIVHIHNLYPFISPAALFACKKARVPVIMTVHNYRLMCPTGLFLRNSCPCEECLIKGNEWGCVKHNCEGSMFRSVGYALRNFVARKTGAYKKCVTYFACLTEFQKQKLIDAGFDRDHIFVFYNYIEDHPEDLMLERREDDYVGFVGRMSEEKGYDLLLTVAKRHPEMRFKFAGYIREDAQLEELPNVEYCGQLNAEQLRDFYNGARFIAMPSRFYEGFPIVLLEAFSHGKACVVPEHGCFPELVYYNQEFSGEMFEPMNADSLEEKVVELWNDEALLAQLSKNARRNYEDRFVKRGLNIKWDKFLRIVRANAEGNKHE